MNKLKILHLEDSHSDAELIKRVLAKGGIDSEILLVLSKESFVAALNEFVPDLILSDHTLPSFNSYEALSIYHERALKIPFILITANVSEEFAVDVIKRGAADYILKDRLERLPSAINNALEKHKLEKEKQSFLLELKKSELHYRSLIENGADVLVVLTTDGKFKYAAPSIHRVLGYSEKDALSLDLFELLHPDDIKDGRRLFTKCVKNPGISIDGYEGRIKNKKDEWLWLEGTMTNMLLDPAINGIVFNFRDITERRLARLQLVRTQLLNKSILSSLDAHIAVVNEDGLIISVNKAWEDFSIANGAIPASLTSNGSNYFTDCENAAANGNKVAAQVLKGLKAVLNKEVELFKLEYPCHSPLEKRWFVLNVTSLGGDETGIVVSHQNVTDRKLAEEKVLLNELMFRGLIENSADGMAILSPQGRPLYVSPTIKNILGYTEDEGMELNLLEMVHPEDAPILIGVMKDAMDNPGVAIKGGVTRMIHKDGNWRWMEGVITNMLHNPAIGGIVDNFRDITDRKMAEQKILHANRLYSFISHINQLIVRVKDDQTLFNDACRIAVEHGKFKMAWIGHLFPTDETIKLVACFGATPKQEEFFSNYSYEPGGPIEKVINGLDYATVGNISAEVKTRLTEIAGEAGFKSVIVLPIKIDSVLKATFNIYSTEVDFFDDQEVELLKEATADISFALEVFEKSKLKAKAERKLLQSEAKLSIAQSIAKLGYWELNLSDQSLFWSDETFRIWGRTREAFVPNLQSLIETIHPDDLSFFVAEQNLASGGHKNLDIEYRIFLPDQSVKWVNDKGQLALDEQRGRVKFEGTVQDITARKEAEEILIKTESRYRQIVETAQEGIWLIDSENKTTFVNSKMCQILEYTESEMLGTELFDYMDDEGKRIALKALVNKRKGLSSHFDFKYITKSGREVWTTLSANPFFDADGNYNGSLAMVSDITEQKALQQLLDKAITLSRMGTYEIDLVNNELFWSAMTREIHEVDQDYQPIFSTAIEFYKEGQGRDTILTAVNDAVEHQIPFDLELEIVTAKGNTRWVRAIGETECHDGICTRLYGSFQDIQKVKTAEIEVLKAYEEKNDILESIDDAFFAVDKNWTITYWNNKAEKVLGRQREDALSKNLWDVYPEVVGTIMWSNYHGALTDNTARHFEAHYETMDIWFEISAYPSSRGLSVFFKDITERKISETRLNEMNKRLQRYADELLISNKGLEQFSYIISHNLRSPVANILGLTEILQSGGNDQESSDILLDDIVTNVQRLDDVIRDLNHILSVKSVLNELKEPVSLTELLSTIRISIKNIIEQENVDFDLNGIQVDKIYSLRSYMHSIFLNLVTNSIKYRRPNQLLQITIGSKSENGKLIICYCDNGRGIDLVKHKDNVFGLYKRFHRDIEGKGVGLFMIKTQTEILGGKVELLSAVDEGVEFTFEFNL